MENENVLGYLDIKPSLSEGELLHFAHGVQSKWKLDTLCPWSVRYLGSKSVRVLGSDLVKDERGLLMTLPFLVREYARALGLKTESFAGRKSGCDVYAWRIWTGDGSWPSSEGYQTPAMTRDWAAALLVMARLGLNKADMKAIEDELGAYAHS